MHASSPWTHRQDARTPTHQGVMLPVLGGGQVGAVVPGPALEHNAPAAQLPPGSGVRAAGQALHGGPQATPRPDAQGPHGLAPGALTS